MTIFHLDLLKLETFGFDLMNLIHDRALVMLKIFRDDKWGDSKFITLNFIIENIGCYKIEMRVILKSQDLFPMYSSHPYIIVAEKKKHH